MPDAPLIRIPMNPVPDGFQTRFLESEDGTRLRVGWTSTAVVPRRGAVLLIPGWAEFIEKYFEVANDLLVRGFDVMIIDPRGQGFSQRVSAGDDRALINDFSKFQMDMRIIVTHFQSVFSGPALLVGHSMGGLITLDYLRKSGGDGFVGAVANAPLTRLFADPVKRSIVHGIVRTGIVLGQKRRHLFGVTDHSMNFEANNLTQDPSRHERFRLLQLAMPEVQAGPPRFAWINAAMNDIADIQREGALADLPFEVLLVSADWDETVDPTHHVELGEQYEKINLVRIKDARHEILMEKDEYRDQFWTAFDAYVASRPGLSASMPPPVSSATPSSSKSSMTSAT